MEEALLKDMIVDRDKKISQLEEAVEDNQNKLTSRRRELEEVREKASESKLQYRRKIASLVKKRDEGLYKIQKVEKEVRNQNGSLHVYADILKEAAQDSVDSSYVVRMQSQLCKAMHSMGILEHQLAIVNAISSDVVKSQKEAITTLTDERSNMELEVMNQLVMIDDAKREVEEEWKAKLEEVQVKVIELRNELGLDDENTDKDSDDEGSSEEEDEYESEMREGLAELNEAIDEMEDETARQKEIIESLKAQLEQLQMSEGTSPDINGQHDSLEDQETSRDLQEQEKHKDPPETPTDNESDYDAEVNGDDTDQ